MFFFFSKKRDTKRKKGLGGWKIGLEASWVITGCSAAMGDHGKVIKIDVEKNPKLSEALRVRGLPTLMIYKGGEMVWRQSGDQDANTIISLMKDFV